MPTLDLANMITVQLNPGICQITVLGKVDL